MWICGVLAHTILHIVGWLVGIAGLQIASPVCAALVTRLRLTRVLWEAPRLSTVGYMSITVRSWVPGAIVATALALALAGCSGGTAGSSASPSTTTSGSASASASKVDALLRPVVTAAMTKMRIPGALVYVAVPGQEPWQAALGVADLAAGTPMEIPDHMRIGSLTKTFTATVVLQLVQEGKLGLDTMATKYLPGAPTNGATVRQLLAMTSGIFNYSEDPAFLSAINADPTKVWTSQELLNFARQNKPNFPAGKGYHYSNTNYIMLGMIAEKASGKPMGDLIRERILVPLSMRGCSYPTDTTIPSPHSQGYQFGAFTTSSTTPPPVPPDEKPNNVTSISPSMAGSAGAMICTLDDMRIWSKALATGQLLSPAMQKERLKAGPPPAGSAAQYGLGISIIGDLLGHNGLILGFQSVQYYNPKEDLSVIVLTNLGKAPDGALPADTLAAEIIGALMSADAPSPTPTQ